MIRDIENAIVARLASKLGNAVAVQSFPDDPKTYRLTHARGAVLVAYRGGVFGRPGASDVVVQEWELRWGLSILMRNLREHGGAYGILDSVRLAMLGWPYAFASGGHAGKMFIADEKFLAQSDGVWTFGQVFAHKVAAVEFNEEDESLLPLLKKLTMDGQTFEDLEVESEP